MILRNKPDWNLLARYMAGETNEMENNAVIVWAEKSPENSALLKDLKSDWSKIDMIQEKFNVDHAWGKLHNRINGIEEVTAPQILPEIKRNLFSVPLKIAASLLFLFAFGVAMVTVVNRIQNITVTALLDEKGKSVELPDGSRIYLNTDAQISYPKRFGNKSREIRLDGEAFFEVTPDKEKPFLIYIGESRIKVLGTSFNVKSKNNDQSVEVYVSTGIVELADRNNLDNRVLINSGDIGIIENNLINLVKAGNANPIAWKTGTMTFVDTPIQDVISLLNNVYDVNISVKGSGVDTIKINGSYQGDPLDDILNVISQHNPQLSIAKSDDTIYLSQ